MAFVKGKAPGKRPDFNVRARTEPGNDASFVTIGAAWRIDRSKLDGNEGFSVKLHSIPINWDGGCLMVVPKVEEAE